MLTMRGATKDMLQFLFGRKAQTAGFLSRLGRNQAANTLAIMAFALIPLIAVAGSAMDMARLYYVKSRLQQACDAGALAGRKFKTGQTLDSASTARANEFFNNNFRDGMFGAETTSFTPSVLSDGQVRGVAATTVPMTLSAVVGARPITLNVSCQAKLEIPNLDIMFVLDTTGSMGDTNPGDTVSKIAGLRTAVLSFYDTIEAAKRATTRVRYGFVPYSSTVNVGTLLRPEWLVDRWTYQSRVQNGSTPGGSTTRTTDNSYSSWKNTSGSVVTTTSSSRGESCPTPANENFSSPTVEKLISQDGTTKVYEQTQTINGTQYSSSFSGGLCTITKRVWNNYVQTRTRTEKPCTTNCTTTSNPTYSWIYKPVEFPVSGFKAVGTDGAVVGGVVTYPMFSDTQGNVTVTWNAANACIEERQTVRQTTYPSIPEDAYDMNIDMVPDPARPETQWKPFLPRLVYTRKGMNNWYYPDWPSNSNTQGLWNYYDNAACPTAARRLNGITRSDLNTYLNSLQPRGYTYHDIGFVWGARLLSKSGIFAGDNTSAPNGGDIDRHIIFMTDGGTDTRVGVYDAYGLSALDRRRTSTASTPSDSDQNTIVANRLGALCTEAKRKGMTVWVIAYGTSLSTMLSNCANEGKAFQANDAGALNDSFRNIATQIARLRVSK